MIECKNDQMDGRMRHSFAEGKPSNEALCGNMEEETGRGSASLHIMDYMGKVERELTWDGF